MKKLAVACALTLALSSTSAIAGGGKLPPKDPPPNIIFVTFFNWFA